MLMTKTNAVGVFLGELLKHIVVRTKFRKDLS